MKKILGILLLFTLGSMLSGCTEVYAHDTEYSDEMFSSFIEFNLNTLDEVATDDNFLFSPLSLYYAMSILYSYSSGTAETELSNLFGISKDELLGQIGVLTEDLPVSDKYTDFSIANFVYYDNTYGEYIKDGLQQYKSVFPYDLEEVDFPSGDAAEKLVEKISDVTDGFLTPSADAFEYLKYLSFLINNTIYYRGTWSITYSEKYTEDDTFHSIGGTDQIVSMMTKRDNHSKYYESNKATAVQNFFKDGSSMIFILPEDHSTPLDVLNDHNEMKKLLQPDSYYEFKGVHITIPKFTFQNTISLNTCMENLGQTSIWEPSTTNFSLITNLPFSIEDITQIAKIQIDEVGVKVAAATTIVGSTSAGPSEIIEFKVDRPFLYVILSPDNIPMFFGSTVSF
ncbi:MAG: serpin family protein [Bacilli bacterium]|nr:serpin family protein [Bacilli bacterium]